MNERAYDEISRTTRAHVKSAARLHGCEKVIGLALRDPCGRMHDRHLRGELRPEEVHCNMN
jgi:hypothetical protein